MDNWLSALIAVSAVIATRFATISAANNYWSASR
ncbi:hexameric tyrosine-coordinated heme protein [Maricaulis sp.]